MAKSPRAPRKGSGAGEGPASGDPQSVAPDESIGAEHNITTLVACGASAGGLEAFSQMVAALPKDVNAAFVLIPHLAPEHASMMAPLLQHHTSLPVTEATEGV